MELDLPIQLTGQHSPRGYRSRPLRTRETEFKYVRTRVEDGLALRCIRTDGVELGGPLEQDLGDGRDGNAAEAARVGSDPWRLPREQLPRIGRNDWALNRTHEYQTGTGPILEADAGRIKIKLLHETVKPGE